MKTAIEVLENYKAGPEAIKWIGHKTTQDAWETCHRGDWMLWIASRLGVDRRKLYLCNAEIAYQIISYTDDRHSSINGVRTAYEFGRGMISFKELIKTREEAGISRVYSDATYYKTITDIVKAIAYYAVADPDKAYLVAKYVSIAHATDIIDSGYVSEVDASKKAKSLAESADICRDILTEEIKKFF
jgi:hypothetical protein